MKLFFEPGRSSNLSFEPSIDFIVAGLDAELFAVLIPSGELFNESLKFISVHKPQVNHIGIIINPDEQFRVVIFPKHFEKILGNKMSVLSC